jgi:hypothetical protein
MRKPVTVRLPSELLNAARDKAAAEDRSLASVVEEGLRRIVDGGSARREPIPVSRATGVCAPGMDLPYSALEELEDLEYVERMKRLQ